MKFRKNAIPDRLRSKKTLWIGLVVLACALAVYIVYAHVLFPTLDRQARSPEEALRPVRFFHPDIRDDFSMLSLERAIEKNLDYLSRLDPDHVFRYGDQRVPCSRVLETQKAFLALIRGRPAPDVLARTLEEEYLFLRAAGRKGNRRVLFTGYYEPVYRGRLSPDDTYRHPLYRRPDDLLRIDLSPFGEAFRGKRITARIEGREVLPYYSRSEIEQEGALAGRDLELAWLMDPVDVAFLHIQGSGRIILPDGSALSLGYAASNGRPYRSIGRYLIEQALLTREEMSMQAIRRFLATHPDMRDEVLNHNPSYIFFSPKPNGPLGNINVQLTPGRSVALDDDLFPKGALCFVSAQKPVVENDRIVEWTDLKRFMINQDTGGAIRGAGRADIFWGRGPYAETAAGHMKHEGDLYVLLKK
ncbi:MAG: MltA domain-containing protein [Deltaproteobacteria bacterium]|nr:MltA domain-containing protein [Deltaproteobacteria bacterium]